MKEYGVCYSRDRGDIEQSLVRSRERVFDTTGVVHDPTMQVCGKHQPLSALLFTRVFQGNREMSVIYSPQFKRIMIERNNSRNKPVDPFRSTLENSIGDILPRLLAFYVNLPAEQQCSARLVLFGPGIESENTKLLVHKIVNARSSTFDAVEFIKGLPGGWSPSHYH